jgi:hypothetical protein
LLRVPGVRDGAVVVTPGRRLAAFYRGPRPIEATVLRDRLGASLPGYMIPAAFHWREDLPLTGTGKVDKKTLATLAGQLEAAGPADYAADDDAPRTPAERRLATAWAEVLGIAPDGISRRDSFFDRGTATRCGPRSPSTSAS